jgi:AcrR family transcriptional regulator
MSIVVSRNPDLTRRAILDAAFHAFYTQGYHGTRVDTIIEQTNFTKGAFYHYFPSKKALASAVIDEIIGVMMQERWLAPLADTPDPVTALIDNLQSLKCGSTEEGIRYGCPLNNFAQELAGADDAIRAQAQQYFQSWIDGIAEALARGQALGLLRDDILPQQAATHIVATFEGGISLAKAARDRAPLDTVMDGLMDYVNRLRTPRKPVRKKGTSHV